MEALFQNILNYLIIFWGYARKVLDIIIVSVLFYWIYSFLSKTRAIQLFKGLVIIIAFFFLSIILKLDTLNWLLQNITLYAVILVMILFQPELRRLITQFGQRNWFGTDNNEPLPLDEVVNAISAMGELKTGSLIVIERNTGLRSYTESGIGIDAVVTEELIRTIFFPNTYLHDGAIIIRNGRISAAACYLPLSDSRQLKKNHGARHRAGLGIAEETDALVLVSSEETGNISIMVNGKLHQKIKATDLKNIILFFMNPKTAYEEKYSIK